MDSYRTGYIDGEESRDAEIATLREHVKMLRDELFRVKGICLREVGIGIVNEVALATTEPKP